MKIDFETAKAYLLELAADRPDYVYDSSRGEGYCFYFNHDGSPSCIVGHVLAEHGVTRQDLGDYNQSNIIVISEDYAGTVNMDAKTRNLLGGVQAKQDSGVRWGLAVETAIQETEAWSWWR